MLQLAGSLEQGHGGIVVGSQYGGHAILDQRLLEEVDLVGVETDQGLEQGPHQLATRRDQQGGDTAAQHQAEQCHLDKGNNTH